MLFRSLPSSSLSHSFLPSPLRTPLSHSIPDLAGQTSLDNSELAGIVDAVADGWSCVFLAHFQQKNEELKVCMAYCVMPLCMACYEKPPLKTPKQPGVNVQIMRNVPYTQSWNAQPNATKKAFPSALCKLSANSLTLSGSCNVIPSPPC